MLHACVCSCKYIANLLIHRLRRAHDTKELAEEELAWLMSASM